MKNIQINKKTLSFILLILILNFMIIISLILKYNDLKDSLNQKNQETNNLISKYDAINKEIISLKHSLNSNKTKFLELDFFTRNQREYKLNNNKYTLVYCCVNQEKNILGYDLLIQRPDGSSDDFGTSSYINFLSYDSIESIKIETVGMVNNNYHYNSNS